MNHVYILFFFLMYKSLSYEKIPRRDFPEEIYIGKISKQNINQTEKVLAELLYILKVKFLW